MPVASGQVLGQGRFEVLSRIGEGGGGLVFEVRDRESDARLALKTVRVPAPEALVSLKREFRAVQDLAHPNLVRLDELFEENGAWFFTMELVDGADWLSYVRPGGVLDEPRLRATLVQIVEALSALHATGTMHRDVKPTNVLVSSSGLVKLLDFGIAARAHRHVESDEGIVGTLAYMPPEQLLSHEPAPAGDFYSVGVMMHEALSGKLPFFDRPDGTAEEKVRSPPTPLNAVAPEVPEDLASLCDGLLEMNPEARPDATAILRLLGANDGPISGEMLATTAEDFVGRASELAILHEAYEATRDGTAITVVVEGASGVGKSALARSFLRGFRGEALILDGRCHEREYVPYKGIDAIVDALAAHLAEQPDSFFDGLEHPAHRLLPRLFPVLLGVPFFEALGEASAPLGEGDAHELRARIFAAFRELLAHVAAQRPLILSIDDVQWADGDTLALLGDLLAPPAPPLLLLCTKRAGSDAPPAEDRPTAESLPLPGVVRRILLGGLSTEDVSALAVHLAHGATLEGGALRRIAEECGGHPLFLQELVRLRLRGKGASSNVGLDDALWGRVALLGERERQIVEAVAVAGAPIALDLLVATGAVSRRDLAPSMAMLRAANFVKVSAARRVEPYHDRVREAVVAHLPPEARRSWHERIARSLEGSAERDVERLAMHWEGAGDAGRAAALFRESAERASNALAFDRAVDFYRRALALTGASAAGRADLQQALAGALLNAGRGEEAGKELAALAGSRADREAILLRSRAAEAFIASGHYEDGIGLLRAVTRTVGLWFPGGRLSVIALMLWHHLRMRLRGLALAERDPRSLPPNEVMRVDACRAAAHGFGMTDSTVATVYHALGTRLALQLGEPLRAARMLSAYALSLSIRAEKGRARTEEAVARARALNALLRDPYVEAFSAAAEGFLAYFTDDFVGANALFARAEAGFRDLCVGAAYELGSVRTMIGRTFIQLGRVNALAPYVGPILRDAVARSDLFNVINTRTTACVFVALARDDVPAAEDDLEMSARSLSKAGFQLQHLYWLVAACTIDVYRGAPGGALARLATQRRALRRSLLEKIQSIRTMVGHVKARAHLAAAEQDPAHRDRHVERAAECARRLQREGLPATTALAQLVQAGVRSLRGDGAGAIALLREASARFEERDMALHLAAARSVLARLLAESAESEESRRLAAMARATFDAARVAAPAKFVALYAPGFAAAAQPGA